MENGLEPVFLIEAAGEVSPLDQILRKSTWVTQRPEALCGRNMGNNACPNVGVVIDFDHPA